MVRAPTKRISQTQPPPFSISGVAAVWRPPPYSSWVQEDVRQTPVPLSRGRVTSRHSSLVTSPARASVWSASASAPLCLPPTKPFRLTPGDYYVPAPGAPKRDDKTRQKWPKCDMPTNPVAADMSPLHPNARSQEHQGTSGFLLFAFSISDFPLPLPGARAISRCRKVQKGAEKCSPTCFHELSS
jgi:hypothetical protein